MHYDCAVFRNPSRWDLFICIYSAYFGDSLLFIKLMVSPLSDEPKKTKDIDVKFDKMFSPIVYIFFVNSMILATQLSLKPELAPNRDLHRFSEIGVINGFQVLGYHLALVLLIINICSFAIYFWKTEVSLNRDVK